MLAREHARQAGPREIHIKAYFGIDATHAEEIRASLCQVGLDEDEQARFTVFWRRVADRLAWSDNAHAIDLHALTDEELDELHQWALLMKARGAALAYDFDDGYRSGGAKAIKTEWGVVALDDER